MNLSIHRLPLFQPPLIFLGIYDNLKYILVYRKYRFRLFQLKFIFSDNILYKILPRFYRHLYFFKLQINFLVLC